MNNILFYKCKDCGKIVLNINHSSPLCCSSDMLELTTNTVDASVEKHLPAYDYENGCLTVEVGSEPHPMTPAHYIEWIYIRTFEGGMYKILDISKSAKVTFRICEDEIHSIYAYCNLHGLWKANYKKVCVSDDSNQDICSPEFSEGCIKGTNESK